MEVFHGSPLKAPAVEIVDLSSEHGVDDEKRDLEREDASSPETDNGDDDDHLSLYEDMLDSMPEHAEWEDAPVDVCTVEESFSFRKRLRLVGEDQFITETIEIGAITAKKLCTAFGIRPPPFLEGQPDFKYFPLLGLGITRELSKRVKLPQYNTIDDAVHLLNKSKNIIVLTGAGISTSLGIPDFRSKETGLYSQLEHLGLSDPQEVFDITIFREDPSIFYSVAKDILPSTRKFSPTHAFIKLLQDKEKLLTNFTQNIDNLESYAGILPEKLIQCHGSFATATCVECGYRVKCEEIYKDLKAGRVARCDRCIRNMRLKPFGIKRKRSTNGLSTSKKKRQSYEDSTDDEDYDIAVAGVMKPDITFFGEDLPETFHDRLTKHDKGLVDLVIVIGTSLKVAPVSEVSGFLPPETPQIYISREPCQHVDFDIDMLGECDTIVTELCRRAGWDLKHEMIKEDDVDVQLHEGYESRYSFRITSA
ncbi:NAD-dependent histone deacetylase sir2 [Xanthoria calcicola]